MMEWQDLGLVPYRKAWELQDRLREKRAVDEIADRLLLLEHPPVITLGRRDCDGDIISPLDVVAAAGIEVVKTNRGGRATYHGPGQLVGYFICSLDGLGLGIKAMVEAVEEICLMTLAEFGVAASRDEKHPGLWIGRNKIVAIGMNVAHGVTQHGFAMNVSCDLDAYRHIVACGIDDRGVTSIERELGSTPKMGEIADRLIVHVGRELDRRMINLTE